MAGTSQKAQLVSARELVDHVQRATELASSKLKLDPAPASLIVRWDLYGRIVRDFAEGERFAGEAVKALDKSVGSVSPAVVLLDKRVVAGFFPVEKALSIRTL